MLSPRAKMIREAVDDGKFTVVGTVPAGERPPEHFARWFPEGGRAARVGRWLLDVVLGGASLRVVVPLAGIPMEHRSRGQNTA